MKNTGKPSEQIFDDEWKLLGKHAFVFKFTDASEAYGLNKKRVNTKAQPSDRLLTYQGETIYAEIKSTVDPSRFGFNLLRTSQSAYAAQAVAAGGRYDVFIHALVTDRWYRVPYSLILQTKQQNLASLRWEALEPYAWSFPTHVS